MHARWLQEVLVCPACRGPLDSRPQVMHCRACSRTYPQHDATWIDLRVQSPAAAWQSRQEWMEQDYRALLDDGEHAAEGFENDFRDIAELLAGYRGRVLDVGGGNGVARHWLPPDGDYVLVECSSMWEDARWQRFHQRFPCLTLPCPRIRAFGERLPFRNSTFDHALCLWTLNHVESVEDTLSEVVRAVRPGGRILAVLEESEPSWLDLTTGRYPHARTTRAVVTAGLAKLMASVRGWPLQPDHTVVLERTIRRTRGARIRRREWRGLYLTFELERLSYLNT